MKNLFTFAIAFLLIISLNAQQTFTTSGNSSDWNSPKAWKMENGDAATQIPGTSDHIIISDYLFIELDQSYTHSGNISIMGNGLLQISSQKESNAAFVFGGQEMNIFGYLISTANFSQVTAPNGKRGLLILHKTANMNYAANFSLLGGMILESSACGATEIEGDFILQSEDAFVCGEGNIMVGGDLRAFNEQGQELKEAEVDAFFAQRSCDQVSFHNQLEHCNNQARVTGTSTHNQFVGVENLEIIEKELAVNIKWESEMASLTKMFTVERSIDGRIYEAIASVDNVGEELYEVLDQQPVQVTSYYRIRQVLNTGQPVYSEVRIYDPNKEIFDQTQVNVYPTRMNTGGQMKLETSRLKDVQSATMEVRTLNGQRIKQEILSVSPNGKIYADIQMDMTPGMYLLVIRLGQEVITKKVQLL